MDTSLPNLYADLDCPVRYFSLARYALVEALRLAGVTRATRVLLPEYLCRDLLAPLALVGAEPVWYPVNEGLAPAMPPEAWPNAAAVLAVDYFGFPQDMGPFRSYVARTGAVLIEDNAHGFLSRDEAGTWLGQRGRLGIYSLRKTLPIPDGAALSVSDGTLAGGLSVQLPLVGAGLAKAQASKARLRRIPLVGSALARLTTAGVRALRRLRTGSSTPRSDPESEREIPTRPEPWAGLSDALRAVDVQAESLRRRRLYAELAELAAEYAVRPVFSVLPEGCVPYGFAFRAEEAGLAVMRREAARRGLDLVPWPDLPAAVVGSAPDYYKNIWLVNFLW